MKRKLYIIGIGKAGSAFAFESGNENYEVKYVTDRSETELELIASEMNIKGHSLTVRKEFIEDSDIILVCVQDRNLSPTIEQIVKSGADTRSKIFFHISGAESTDVFPREYFDRSNVASVHPIQTFDKRSRSNEGLLSGIYFGIEGEGFARQAAIEFVQSLQSKHIDVPKDKKLLYHSACVVSSNFLITLLNVSSEIMNSTGIEKSKTVEIFRPIIENTLKNISRDGLVNSLTGPFERNDLDTISGHLNSIHKDLPSLIPFYTLLGMETVRVAFRKESISMKNVISILDLMNEYITAESDSVKKTIH